MESMVNPDRLLKDGVRLLGRVLLPKGFVFHPGPSGSGSGGSFATGSFQCENRSISLSFRYSLGLVTYRVGGDELDHATYMRYLGSYGRNRYPGHNSSPIEAFEDLAFDLETFCAEFLDGEAMQFRAFARDHKRNPSKFAGLAATR